MEECQARHLEHCWSGDRVPRLRMITVATGEVVSPLTDGKEPYSYAALSYVWGDAAEAHTKPGDALRLFAIDMGCHVRHPPTWDQVSLGGQIREFLLKAWCFNFSLFF